MFFAYSVICILLSTQVLVELGVWLCSLVCIIIYIVYYHLLTVLYSFLII